MKCSNGNLYATKPDVAIMHAECNDVDVRNRKFSPEQIARVILFLRN